MLNVVFMFFMFFFGLLELRCDKVMDTFSGYALCLPNLTQLNACHFGDHRLPLCVEIKVTNCCLSFNTNVNIVQ